MEASNTPLGSLGFLQRFRECFSGVEDPQYPDQWQRGEEIQAASIKYVSSDYDDYVESHRCTEHP